MKRLFSRICFLCFVLWQPLCAHSDGLQSWIEQQSALCWEKLYANISPPGTTPGVVVASPSVADPDYYYHWIRDAALVMDVVLQFCADEDRVERLMQDYLAFSLSNQAASSRAGLGEAKFHVDGHPYDGAWGRPQNDGPALRAISCINYAQRLLDEQRSSELMRVLYAAVPLSHTLIASDLRYIIDNWHKSSFDLWEELRGQHFYTLMVQRRALLDGAELAARLGDAAHAGRYRQEARLIEAAIEEHLCRERGLIIPTLHQDAGLEGKNSHLDVAVILAVLHGGRDDGFLPASHPLVLGSAQALRDCFAQHYAINQRGLPGVLLGRYPEDVYYGGNPWVLTSIALAELYLRAAGELELLEPQRASQLREAARTQFARLRVHCPEDGALAEQMDRNTGYMLAAPDLTWSYGAFLTAAGRLALN